MHQSSESKQYTSLLEASSVGCRGGEYRLTTEVVRVLIERNASGLAGLKGHSSMGIAMGRAECGS